MKQLNPNRIYVENIRSFYNITTKAAKFLCEMAVKDNLYAKKIGAVCPNCKSLILAANSVEEIPEKIKCSHCEMLENDKYEFAKSEIETIEFYQLIKPQNEPKFATTT